MRVTSDMKRMRFRPDGPRHGWAILWIILFAGIVWIALDQRDECRDTSTAPERSRFLRMMVK